MLYGRETVRMRLLRVDQTSMPFQLLQGLIQTGGTLGIAKQKLLHSKVAFNLSKAFLKGMSDSFL